MTLLKKYDLLGSLERSHTGKFKYGIGFPVGVVAVESEKKKYHDNNQGLKGEWGKKTRLIEREEEMS